MPRTNTEWKVVQALNKYYEANDIDAYAHRLKMGGYTPQHIDILSLSGNPRYYLGIECKSAVQKNFEGVPFTVLYFSRYFHTTADGNNQVTNTAEYLKKSGLTGYMAFELRIGRGRKNHLWFVPFEVVEVAYNEGLKGLTIEEIEKYPDILEVGIEGVL
jgi:hypothetical protein